LAEAPPIPPSSTTTSSISPLSTTPPAAAATASSTGIDTNDSHKDELDPLTEFFSAIRNPLTRRAYKRRLFLFLDFLLLGGEGQKGNYQKRAREFVLRARKDPLWATIQINEYMRKQKTRAERKEISESTLPNYWKPIKLFCEENDIALNFRKISRRIPRGRSAADDRIPTFQEIKRLLEYPDRRVRIAVLVMATSGARIGAFDYLNWGHIEPLKKKEERTEDQGGDEAGEGAGGNHHVHLHPHLLSSLSSSSPVVAAAKIKIYAGTKDEYFSFITQECYSEIKEYIEFRESSGEKITRDSPLLRDLFFPEKGGRGSAQNPKRFGHDALRNLIYHALVASGLRKSSLPKGKKRHEFSADHSFRKYFTTICLRHTSSLNVQILRGDDTGLMESYNRPTEEYLFQEYLKCVPELTFKERAELSASFTSSFSQDLVALKRKVDILAETAAKLESEILGNELLSWATMYGLRSIRSDLMSFDNYYYDDDDDDHNLDDGYTKKELLKYVKEETLLKLRKMYNELARERGDKGEKYREFEELIYKTVERVREEIKAKYTSHSQKSETSSQS
jgi:hypothetical protein